MRHSINKEPGTKIGEEASGEQWRDDELNSVHRLDQKRQSELIEEIYTKLNLPKPTLTESMEELEKDVGIEFDQLAETMLVEPVFTDLNDTLWSQDLVD